MARGVPLAALIALLLASSAGAEGSILASYDFDSSRSLATGPDTFAVFQHARGSVRLASEYRVSGHHALELRDVRHDGDFPELQGYFPVRATGRVLAHFALLVATPDEELNVALAGPAWFALARDGIAFRLQTQDGWLVHHSDSIPKKLFRVEAFTWYVVDVDYDVAAGRYDLGIRREADSALVVDLRSQRNAANQPGSAVDKFSFAGDPFTDTSDAAFYVDDVVIGTDEQVRLHPFVAPGRRKLFVDRFLDESRVAGARPRCPAALVPLDLGASAATLKAKTGMEGLRTWQAACTALEAGRAGDALAVFERLAREEPAARLFPLSEVAALTALGRFDTALERLAVIRGAWGDDPRWAIASAVLGTAQGDLERAADVLRLPAEGEDPLVAERYFHVLLWNGRLAAARDYALQRAAGGAPEWLERAGDATFLLRDLAEATARYEAALRRATQTASLLLKLADVAFLQGEAARERQLRERVYGRVNRGR